MVAERPRAWISDTSPKISKSQDGGLVITGDPVYSRMQWLLIWSVTATIGFGFPFMTDMSLTSTGNRLAFAAWSVGILALPSLLLLVFPSTLKVDTLSRSLTIKSGGWRPRRVTIPFEHVLNIRRKRVSYMILRGRLPPERIETDLAYLDIKPDVPSLHSNDALWGAPILSVNASCMDLFLEICERHQIQIT